MALSRAQSQAGGREQAFPIITAAYGVTDRLESGLGIQRVNKDLPGEAPARGVENLHLRSKFRIMEESEIWLAAAASADVSVPTANKPKGSPPATRITLCPLFFPYEGAGLHLNVGYLLVDSPRGEKLKNPLTDGIAGEYAMNPH